MLTYIGRAHAWGLEDLREGTVYDPVSLIGALDEIAYVRFASVYRQFRDASEFVSEIQSLKKE